MIYQGTLYLLVGVDLRMDERTQESVENALINIRDTIDKQLDQNALPWTEHLRIGVVEQVRATTPIDLPEEERQGFLDFEFDPEPEVDDTAYDDPWSPTQD